MTDAYQKLRELCGEIPADLATYLEQTASGALSGQEDLELNLLPIEEALRFTSEFRDFHPAVAALRGVILDDANTSNHHVYLCHPACAGCVLHLAHDDESQIVFASLDAFVTACHEAKQSGKSLTSLHPATAV